MFLRSARGDTGGLVLLLQRRRTTCKNRGEASHCGTLPDQTESRAFFGGAHSADHGDARHVSGCANISPDVTTFSGRRGYFLGCFGHFLGGVDILVVRANILWEARNFMFCANILWSARTFSGRRGPRLRDVFFSIWYWRLVYETTSTSYLRSIFAHFFQCAGIHIQLLTVHNVDIGSICHTHI
jgi:hypothetical protein